MLIVLTKVDTPADPNVQHRWDVIASFQSDTDLDGDNGDDRLRGLGGGELKVFEIDPDKEKIKVRRKVKVKRPPKAQIEDL